MSYSLSFHQAPARMSLRLRRHLALWMAALLIGAPWLPALSAGLSAGLLGPAVAGTPNHWAEVCSAHGTHWVSLETGAVAAFEPAPDTGSLASPSAGGGSSGSGHCAVCLVPYLAALPSLVTQSEALPAPVTVRPRHTESFTIRTVPHGAQARAPPLGH